MDTNENIEKMPSHTNMIVISIALVIMFIIILVLLLKTGKATIEEADDNVDILVHHSSEKLPLPAFIREMQSRDPAFISGNQTTADLYYTETADKSDIPFAAESYSASTTNNYNVQYSSKFREAWNAGDYIAVDRSKFKTIGAPLFYKLNHGVKMYVAKVVRLVDNIEFYQVMLTQTFSRYEDPNSYRGIHAAIAFLQNKHPGEYIISGDFNVHGHEAVFKKLLPNYLICNFAKVPTCMDNEGLASPDGVVVSPKLYKYVEYHTELCNGVSYQHFVVVAKLYRKNLKSGVALSKNWPLRAMIKDVVSNYGTANNFYGKAGAFDPEAHAEKPNLNIVNSGFVSTGKTLRANNFPKPTPPNS